MTRGSPRSALAKRDGMGFNRALSRSPLEEEKSSIHWLLIAPSVFFNKKFGMEETIFGSNNGHEDGAHKNHY
jgi:hypothetical protein